MQADTLDRTDSIEDVVGDHAIVCDITVGIVLNGVVMGGMECTEPAAWIGNAPCCGEHALVCKHHFKTGGLPWFCSTCKKSYDHPINWRPL